MIDYLRGDQATGITAPDLSKTCSFAEHIVRARGKRTQYTSVSLDPTRITDFGEVLYHLKQPELQVDAHELVEHAAVMTTLRQTVESEDKAERARAIQALRYARKRVEGLVRWKFNTGSIAQKDLINWAGSQVQKYFVKV